MPRATPKCVGKASLHTHDRSQPDRREAGPARSNPGSCSTDRTPLPNLRPLQLPSQIMRGHVACASRSRYHRTGRSERCPDCDRSGTVDSKGYTSPSQRITAVFHNDSQTGTGRSPPAPRCRTGGTPHPLAATHHCGARLPRAVYPAPAPCRTWRARPKDAPPKRLASVGIAPSSCSLWRNGMN